MEGSTILHTGLYLSSLTFPLVSWKLCMSECWRSNTG